MYPVPQRQETQGRSEELLGEWIRAGERQGSWRREDHYIVTKVAGPGNMPWIRGGPLNVDANNIRAAIEGSLRRLRTDYVNCYLIHWPDR
jgi:aryl-alcohol dehydrogenase-like predicted oxidoreductase